MSNNDQIQYISIQYFNQTNRYKHGNKYTRLNAK